MESCEPVSRNRAMGLLNAMLAWPQFNTKTSFLAQILKLETAFAEYNKTGSTISEEIKSAVLLGSVTGTLKTWLQLRVTDATSYQELRDSILSFERSTTKWSDAMVLGSDLAASSSEAVPMEVDSVTGKGVKGKTKGKDGKGGKTGDGKNQPQWFDYKGGKGKGKGNNNAWSSGGTGSGSWTSPEKGKGKNKGKGKTDGKNKGVVVETTTREAAGTRKDLYSKLLRKVLCQGRIRLLQQLRRVVARQVPTRVHHEGVQNHSVMHINLQEEEEEIEIEYLKYVRMVDCSCERKLLHRL